MGMEDATDRLVLKLARVYVPPHIRVVSGKPVRVDGYWKDSGSLTSGEKKAIAGDRPGAKGAGHIDEKEFAEAPKGKLAKLRSKVGDYFDEDKNYARLMKRPGGYYK